MGRNEKTNTSSDRTLLNEINSNKNQPFDDSTSAASTSTGAEQDGRASTISQRTTARSVPPASNDGKTAAATEPILPLAQGNGHTQATKPHENAPLKRHTTSSKNPAMSFFRETIPSFLAVSVMLSLIFGGCCSNVFALEAIIKPNPDSGKILFLLCPARFSQNAHSSPYYVTKLGD